MGLYRELELLRLLKGYGLNCVHGLEQRHITDFLVDADPDTKKTCQELLRKNRMLPRNKLTYQIDLLAWKNGHWAALAIEQKAQNGVKKVLDINKDFVTLRAEYEGVSREYRQSGRNLFLQCQGEALLGKAYYITQGISAEIIPVGVVDYELRINSAFETDWAYHRGVFFVNSNAFEWFVNEYVADKKWIRRTVLDRPKISFPHSGFGWLSETASAA